MRDTFILKCTECGEENYISSKNKNSTNSRLIKLSKNDKIFTEKSEKEVIKNG